LGQALALPAIIRFGWEFWPSSNALAYWLVTKKKSFITLAAGG